MRSGVSGLWREQREMKIIEGIPVWGSPVDEGAMSQMRTCMKTADKLALMADHHKGYAVPIGGVVAYRDKVSPSGVGFDIACGNKAILTDALASEVRSNIAAIMDDVWRVISFGVGRKNEERVDHELFDDQAWTLSAVSGLKEMARAQLGTVGSGNHYVDIFADELDRVWIGVHFGSRGFGHKTATFFLNQAGAKDGMDVEPCVQRRPSARFRGCNRSLLRSTRPRAATHLCKRRRSCSARRLPRKTSVPKPR